MVERPVGIRFLGLAPSGHVPHAAVNILLQLALVGARLLQLFYSKNASPGPNGANYSNAEYDSLYEQVRVMSDSDERTQLYARMARMISEDCPVILTTQPQFWLLAYDWVKNVKPHPIGYGFRKYRRIDVDLRARRGGGR